MISLSPGQQITMSANVSYALPPYACLVTFQSASAVTVSSSNDNSSFTTLATGLANETKSVTTSAAFIKADQITTVNVAKQIAPVSGGTPTNKFEEVDILQSGTQTVQALIKPYHPTQANIGLYQPDGSTFANWKAANVESTGTLKGAYSDSSLVFGINASGYQIQHANAAGVSWQTAGVTKLALSKMADGILRVAIDGTGGNVAKGGGISIGDTAANSTRPAASAAVRGTFWITWGGAGVADIVSVCVKDAADAYSWKTVTIT
jgi:hypothetical protein